MPDNPIAVKNETRRDNDSGGVIFGVECMLQAAAYSSIQQPLNGVTQLIRHLTPLETKAPDLISAPTHDNMWTTTGSIAGTVGDFFLLSKGVGGLRRSLIGRATSVPILEAGTTGALFELSMPVSDKDFATNKLKSAALGFGTFATMDGASIGLRRLSIVNKAPTFIGAVGVNGLSGAAGGLTHSVLGAGLDGKTPTYGQIKSDVASFAAFGAMFGALDYGAAAGKKAVTTRINDRIAHGEPLFTIGPIEIHQKGFSKQAAEKGQIDGLTGLKNKTGGSELLKSEIARSERSGEKLSMTFLDLDNFKTVNDRFGHNHGDQVLKEVRTVMDRYYQRGTDVKVREGGDEFLVVMPNTELAHAETLASGFEKFMRLAVGKEAPTPEQLRHNYPARIAKIQELPQSIPTGAGQKLGDLAEELVSSRMALTGENLGPETIKIEVKRLKERTGLSESEDLGGRTLQVYNDVDIANFAHRTGFSFLPQISQMLKVKGYATEAQIQEVFQIQSTYPKGSKRPFIGQLLVDKGYTTQAQVEDVFRSQMIAKEALSRILESTPGIQMDKLGIRPFRVPERFHVLSDLTPLRHEIPDNVDRPNLDRVRRLNFSEAPVQGEVVVGASTGVVEWKPGESVDAFKGRGDQLMFDKKKIRKAQGLRTDRVEEPAQ